MQKLETEDLINLRMVALATAAQIAPNSTSSGAVVASAQAYYDFLIKEQDGETT